MNKKIIILIIIFIFGTNLSFGMNVQTFNNLIQSKVSESLDVLSKGNLSEFDALVGDTACQIRALIILILYKKFIKNQNLDKDELEFIVLSYLLTKFKYQKYNESGVIDEKITLDAIQKEFNISKTKASEFQKKAQTRLSELSVYFIQKEATTLKDQELQNALSLTYEDSKMFRRKHAACFPVLKTVLISALKNNIPIAITIKKFCNEKVNNLIFLYKSNETSFYLTDEFSKEDLDRCIIFEGFSKPELPDNNSDECNDIKNFAKQFSNEDIMIILLGNAAQHSQFVGDYKFIKDETGKDISRDIPYDSLNIPKMKEEIAQLRKIALTKGFCLENPKMFQIDHIFSDSLTNSKKIIFIKLLKEILERNLIKKILKKYTNFPKNVQNLIFSYVYLPCFLGDN